MIKCECQTIVLCFYFLFWTIKTAIMFFMFMFLCLCFLLSCFYFEHIFLFSFRQDSNVNIIHFCKLKDGVIEQEYSIAEEAKESYKSLLNDNLDNEKILRERK